MSNATLRNNVVASIVVAELSPSALALHQEAVEYFASGHTILQAASSYAGAADTFYHRGLVWIISQGFHLLPANEKGKAPSIKDAMEQVSSDSKNAARAMLQEIYSLAWQAHQKGIDALLFASLRAMRDGVRAKDKTIGNESVESSLASASEAPEAPEAEAVKLAVSADEVAQMVEDRAILDAIRAELAKAKPSIKALRELVAA
jgi:hypothetical protein